jgi:hypothetical protein
MFLCKVKNSVGKSIAAKQHQMKWTVVGGVCTCTLCAVFRISCIHVHIFMSEGTERSVFHIHGLQPHTGPVTTVGWCSCLALCSCVPSWCSELQQFQRFAMWITIAASHQWSRKTERMESSAGTEQLLTEEWGSTVWAAWRTARQVHDRASAQTICERRNHKVTWEQYVQDCYNQMLPVSVTGIPWQ